MLNLLITKILTKVDNVGNVSFLVTILAKMSVDRDKVHRGLHPFGMRATERSSLIEVLPVI